MSQTDRSYKTKIPRIFVICDRRDTAPVWGYILRQQGLYAILETSIESSIDRWSVEAPDLLVIDVDIPHPKRMDLYQRIRETSIMPILFILPSYNETEVLEAYASGVDEVVIKPISPPVFMAKIMAWIRRDRIGTVSGLNLVHTSGYLLDSSKRCLINEKGEETRLTNLEFRLLYLLMNRAGYVFSTDEIIQFIWSIYGDGDQVLLKNVVYRLRKKIEADPSHPSLLLTSQGGYMFQG